MTPAYLNAPERRHHGRGEQGVAEVAAGVAGDRRDPGRQISRKSCRWLNRSLVQAALVAGLGLAMRPFSKSRRRLPPPRLPWATFGA